jgi:hypothetical protein|nr:hypothetical protein [uncultured Caldimonas sp.]
MYLHAQMRGVRPAPALIASRREFAVCLHTNAQEGDENARPTLMKREARHGVPDMPRSASPSRIYEFPVSAMQCLQHR